MPQVFKNNLDNKKSQMLTSHNKSKIPPATLNNIIRIIEMRIPEIEQKWMSTFSKISYYC